MAERSNGREATTPRQYIVPVERVSARCHRFHTMLICTTCERADGDPYSRPVRSPAELTDIFRANSLKVTPQRQLLFRLMYGNECHPTADSLFARASEVMPGISLRTVYQTLTDLAAMGELRSLDLGTGATRFDPNTDDHHHVVCDGCGDVRDVYVSGTECLAVDGLGGFEVRETSILFTGVCPRCAAG
jgi:Fe2+ or Zn2+ uptake regulation protein